MKNIQKSIRLTEETYNLLMSMSGVGLSEKIETLVHSYVDELPKLEKKIAERKRYLSSVDDEILKKEKLLVNLNHIERYIRSAVPYDRIHETDILFCDTKNPLSNCINPHC